MLRIASGWNRQGQNMLKGLNGTDGLNGLSWMSCWLGRMGKERLKIWWKEG